MISQTEDENKKREKFYKKWYNIYIDYGGIYVKL